MGFRKAVLLVTMGTLVGAVSCKKKDDATTTTTTTTNNTAGSSLRVLTGSGGQRQTITANIDADGYVNFDAQQLMADGGSPLRNYTWTFDNSTTAPSGITIVPQTGVMNRAGHTATGLSAGTTSLKVSVYDGSTTATGYVNLVVSNYTPGPAAILQQLTSSFTLVDGVASKAYGASLYAKGGTPPYSWWLDDSYAGSADLTAAGLSVDGASGIVRGTVMASASGKTIKFKVKLSDSAGDTAIAGTVYTINIK